MPKPEPNLETNQVFVKTQSPICRSLAQWKFVSK